MKASTLTIERVDAEGWQETAGVLDTLQEQEAGGYGALLTGVADKAGAALGGTSGGLVQGAGRVLGGLLDGKTQGGPGGGKALGALAGTALGAVLGGPVGSALGAVAGEAVGGAIGGAVEQARKKPASKHARQAARAKAQAKKQARLAQLEAAEKARQAAAKPTAPPSTPAAPSAGTAPASPAPVASERDTPPGVVRPQPLSVPPARPGLLPPAGLPDYPPELRDFRATLSPEQAARLDQGVRERRGVEVLMEMLAERRDIEAMQAEIARQRRDPSDDEQFAREQAERAAQFASEQAEREQLAQETAAPVAPPPPAPKVPPREVAAQPASEPQPPPAREPSRVAQAPREAAPSPRETAPREAAPSPREAAPPPVAAPAPAPEAAAQLARAPQPPRSSPERAKDTRSAVPVASADTSGDYDDAAAPPARRPQPKRHLGLIPMKQHQLEALLVKVPALRRLDTRLLRLMSGRGSTVRDTAGIDPSARAYVALPGETAAGIAKKLTGREERAADLLAANPARREGEPWRIPPGWMHFVATDTGDPGDGGDDTSGTSRIYIVQAGDTPVGVAQKSGAKAVRPRWWTELKAANPQIPTKDNGQNFERFYAGQQLWIPEEWPASAMFQPAPGAAPKLPPSLPQIPGLPGLPAIPGLPVPGPTPGPAPGPTTPNTTIDPGVPLQAQAMLAYWATSNPGACNPSDYGSTVADLTGTTSTRFVLALTSFQAWHNARNPAAPLRVDGVLDGPTYQALYAATIGAVAVPGPNAVPWPKPTPQQPPQQGSPQQPAPGGLPGILGGLLGGANGVPGINGGLPQLGGGAVPNGNNVPIPTPRTTPGQLPPGAVPGFHVAGMPANVVWGSDGSMVTLPPGMQPLDVIYGTPPPDFVWQGGNSMPGPQTLPWVQPASPQPMPSLPWPWNPANGPTGPTPPATTPAQPPSAPAKDDGALPIAGLLAALAFVS